MIKNLKYRLVEIITGRRVRIGGMAIIMACTIAAVTLLGCPIHTAEAFEGQRFHTLNKMYLPMSTAGDIKETTPIEVDLTPKTYPVYVTCGDKTVTVDFVGGTVADALKLAGFTPDSDDMVEPSLDTEITDKTYIDFKTVEYVKGEYTESVRYETKIVRDSDKEKGYTKLTQKGTNGQNRVIYTEKLVNGVSAGKTVVETVVVKEPQNAVKVMGTKVTAVKTSADVKEISTLTPNKEIKLDKNGNPVSFKKKMTVRATAYTYTGNNCSTGVAPQPGYIAVNPKVIPYGTKMYIKSPNGSVIYGYAVAADTGGFIRRHPTGIDLFMETRSACTNFGVRNMEIYILE